MNFKTWLDTFIDEKGIDRETVFEVEGPEWGTNYIPAGVVLEHIEAAPAHDQKAIKEKLVWIDFHNASVLDFLKHLAGAIAR